MVYAITVGLKGKRTLIRSSALPPNVRAGADAPEPPAAPSRFPWPSIAYLHSSSAAAPADPQWPPRPIEQAYPWRTPASG
jgi:hypothetical protein